MNIFHEATKRLETKNKYLPAIFKVTGSLTEINGIISLYGIFREVKEDSKGNYYLMLPFKTSDIIDEAINIRSELDRKG
jgi:hypothetical protein